jgi:hypothetical protein
LIGMTATRLQFSITTWRMLSVEDEKKPEHSNVHYIKRPRRLVSRTRLVMCLLLIVAIPIFIGLANKAVRENADAIRQGFGR